MKAQTFLTDEITPKALYLNRRQFLRSAGILGSAALLAACSPAPTTPAPTLTAATPLPDVATDQKTALSFNNYYEFSLSKADVAELAADFPSSPWSIEVGGLVEEARTISMADLLEEFEPEERVYRMRCVEGYSMVLPWTGFPLSRLLESVKPTSDAQYVAFETAHLPAEMPGIDEYPSFPWPYNEGLRLDEASHDLTILATGLYGEPLPNQNGAPVRLVVPWKYGFKSIKALTRITLTNERPPNFWNTYNPREYGFYANVNPAVPHPRWSQALEIRLGESERRPTLLFNGYDEVASLYEGLDLRSNY